jgi:hypothetical protein
MVAGESCAKPVVPEEAGVELLDPELLPESPNRSEEAWLKPVDCVDDEPDEVSDLMAFSADEAAPRANSMVKLRQVPHRAAHTFHPTSANAVPSRKAQ